MLADSAVNCLVLDASAIDLISARHPKFREILLANLARELASTLRRATRWIGALA